MSYLSYFAVVKSCKLFFRRAEIFPDRVTLLLRIPILRLRNLFQNHEVFLKTCTVSLSVYKLSILKL